MPGPVDFAKWLGQQVFNVVVGPADWGGEAEEDTGLVDLQCGKTVFHNVPARMRTELWLSQLHKTGTADAAMRQYRKLLAQVRPRPLGRASPFFTLYAAAHSACGALHWDVMQGVREEVLAEINKDTHRTFPGHARLSTPAGQNAMLRMLAAYAALDPEVGYTQGMNFVAGAHGRCCGVRACVRSWCAVGDGRAAGVWCAHCCVSSPCCTSSPGSGGYTTQVLPSPWLAQGCC